MTAPRLLDGRLKLRHLVLIDALTEKGSVVAAAAALHITQPVVTRALKEVENILGVELYERGPRGITPTEAGVVFTGHARAVLAELSQAARHIEELSDASRGQVTVGIHLAGTNVLVPRAIARLKAERPQLTVIVREGSPEQLLKDLSVARVDLVVSRLTHRLSSDFRSRSLYQETVRFVVRDGHPLAQRAAVGLDDILAFPWTVPGRETALREELETFLRVRHRALPQDRVETTSFLTSRRLLLEADFVSVLPESIAADDPRFVFLPHPLDAVGDTVGLVYATNARLSPATQALVRALVEAAAEVEGGTEGGLERGQ